MIVVGWSNQCQTCRDAGKEQEWKKRKSHLWVWELNAAWAGEPRMKMAKAVQDGFAKKG